MRSFIVPFIFVVSAWVSILAPLALMSVANSSNLIILEEPNLNNSLGVPY